MIHLFNRKYVIESNGTWMEFNLDGLRETQTVDQPI